MPVTIAIVGRPNVGKSRLFNALLGRKAAIVHDQPGVTRDPNIAEIAPGLDLVDTGGWGLSQVIKGHHEEAELLAAVENQVAIAVEEASAILFVVDGRSGLTSLDQQIASWLRPFKEKVTVIINKMDSDDVAMDEGEIARLGFKKSWLTSAEHNKGIDTLRSRLLPLAPKEPSVAPSDAEVHRPVICIIGRPNVGKSSLTNALLKSPKMIVSPLSGTTRDPVAVDLDYKGKKGLDCHFRLIDTAGLRHRTKVESSVEVFSQIKARQAMDSADIVIFVLDATEGVTSQDKLLSGQVIEAGKPFVVAVNKWDLAAKSFEGDRKLEGYDSLEAFERACREDLEGALFFVANAPFVFLSAKEGVNLDKLLAATQKVEASQDQHWATPEINKLFSALLWKNMPRNATGKFFKIYYATQTSCRPYRVKAFCNNVEGVNDAFRRYLSRGFAEHFGVEGCPVFFDFVSKPKRVNENRPIRTLKPRQKQRLSKSKRK
jgi:GTPase